MSEQIVPLDELMKELSPEHQRELRDFAEFLLARHRGRRRGKPRFEWAGALSDLRGRYNSVELQHQISRWRIEGE
jgi:uncharacterized protein DUF2281